MYDTDEKQIITHMYPPVFSVPLFLCGQNQSSKVANSVETNNGCIRHPWQGKRVGYLGDSITDPNCYGDKIKKYWDFLQEWLGITPLCIWYQWQAME